MSHILELTERAFPAGPVRDAMAAVARLHDLAVSAQDWHAVRVLQLALHPHCMGWQPTMAEHVALLRCLAVVEERETEEPERVP